MNRTYLMTCALALLVAADAAARDVPEKHIPQSVLLELRILENQFRSALSNDCAPERCYIKGCVYQDHLTLDQPRTASLPGLPTEEGVGSVVPQEYLTQARCEFSHEKNVPTQDVNKLARRLEKRLSHGWLTVTVTPEALEPIPKSLAETEPEAEIKPDPEPIVAAEPAELDAALAQRQLWDALLPHAPWMVALFLLTLAILILIWAGRKLGVASFEDRMLEAQMAKANSDETPSSEENAAENEEVAAPEVELASEQEAHLEAAFAEEQNRLWSERIERISHEDDDVIARLLREWLNNGEYPTLARALFVFGDRVSQAFESAPELALKKVEFASYLRDVDEASLPSKAKFFRHLNQQAMATLLLSQHDVKLYRSLREDFGSSGFVSLMRGVPDRSAALIFALIPFEQQDDVAQLMAAEMRVRVAAQLLASTRISLNESAYLLACVEAARNDELPPQAPPTSSVNDFGPAVDSAGALSMLLPHISSEERSRLFATALNYHGGTAPQWYENIVFGHMLSNLPDEIRNDLLLEVDVHGLAAWLQRQTPNWRRAFVNELTGPLQNALAQTASAASPQHQAIWAKRGQAALVKALKGAYARRGVRFVDLVA